MRYVVIGASAAGIRELDNDAEVVLVSKDEHVYSRCILHHYISNHRDVEALNFTGKDFFEKYNINWKKGIEITSVNDVEQTLSLSNGEILAYDKLMICSGASAFIPPVEGLRTSNNVVGLRNLEDAVLIKEQAAKVKNVVVLGAGLVGIDALSGLLDSGVNISLVEMSNKVLPLQLDEYTSNVYKNKFEEKGVNLKLGVSAVKLNVDENNNPVSLSLNNGEDVPCELVIVATGVRSNIAFLENSNVECDRFGLLIDEKGKTNIDNIYGAGDVTGRNPIWPTAVKEGIIASKIAAHAADIAKGIPGATDWDNAMSQARRDLDWEKMFDLAIDSEKARRYRAESKPENEDTCTMCGKMCAVRNINKILKGEDVDIME